MSEQAPDARAVLAVAHQQRAVARAGTAVAGAVVGAASVPVTTHVLAVLFWWVLVGCQPACIAYSMASSATRALDSPVSLASRSIQWSTSLRNLTFNVVAIVAS